MWARASMSSGGGTLNPSIVERKITNQKYTDTITVNVANRYLILTFFSTSSFTKPDFDMYTLVNGVLTLADSYHTNTGTDIPPIASISGNTLSINYNGRTYSSGYYVIQLS